MGKALALSTFPQAGRRADLSGLFLSGADPHFVVTSQASWPMKDRMGSVMVLPDLDVRLDEMRAQRAGGDLEFQPVERHAIIVAQLSLPTWRSS